MKSIDTYLCKEKKKDDEIYFEKSYRLTDAPWPIGLLFVCVVGWLIYRDLGS